MEITERRKFGFETREDIAGHRAGRESRIEKCKLVSGSRKKKRKNKFCHETNPF